MPLSLQEMQELLDPKKPLTYLTASEVLEFVGLNEMMLSRISNLPDANVRLNFIRSLLLMVGSLNEGTVRQIATDEIVNGPVRIDVGAVLTPSKDADKVVYLRVSNMPATTAPTRIH
ncbi:MAG TPA: hypothetical protein VFK94_05225 [Patescibacteria group bacterium]|nr:hypothetical protein [Patescibacteria group bacterium]